MNKDLEYYLSLPYRVVLYPNKEDNGYTACIPDLPGCITCAETWEELRFMIEDAKKSWIICTLEDGLPIPEPETKERKTA